ncbi:MAG TPA: MarR family transcriptional regulator, partial [Thermoanaerobaculia bacterium]
YYYFYFIDEVLGLCFLSVPTWCPFRTQFYFNGHNWLASKLKAARISFELQDNAIVALSNWRKAQDLSDNLAVTELHARMDAAVARYVPDLEPLGRYHWSIAQAEYATDIVFRSAADLAPLYDHLLRTSIHAIKADDIATFLGRSPATAEKRETGGDFSIRIHGTRVRHYLGPASIKMYDKHGFILRVETTTNDVSFFRHHRMVEQRDGQRVMKLADLKKSIYSLFPDLASISHAANDRYIHFLSAIDDPTPGLKAPSKISDSVEEREHRYRGFNLFDDDDQNLFEILCRGEFFIQGFRNRSLREHLGHFRSSQISRLLKRLRLHGIIKKLGRTYKYYLTELGRHVAVAGLTLKNLFLVPEFAAAALAH